MTPADRAQLVAVTAQYVAVKEQAVALGMMVETLGKALEAFTIGQTEPEPPAPEIPARPKYFNTPTTTGQAAA